MPFSSSFVVYVLSLCLTTVTCRHNLHRQRRKRSWLWKPLTRATLQSEGGSGGARAAHHTVHVTRSDGYGRTIDGRATGWYICLPSVGSGRQSSNGYS
ncbi:hypothetical protein EDB83DRAFT_2458854 [Lactarius deliciosus]|nr:hypothetical protein EDB83DRAFT_2458854 [Lactarius deliciosus]